MELARRKDRRKLTAEDWAVIDSLIDKPPGITAADVMRVFPGAKVIKVGKAVA